jgi:hypothetical protein
MVSAKPNAGKAAEIEPPIFPVFFFLSLGRDRGGDALQKEQPPERLNALPYGEPRWIRRIAKEQPITASLTGANQDTQNADCSLSGPIRNQRKHLIEIHHARFRCRLQNLQPNRLKGMA